MNLQQAVNSVKNTELRKGATLTDEQIAARLGIQPTQFSAYLEGTAPVPEDLPKRVLEAYGHKLVTVTSVVKERYPRPPEEKDKG